MNQEESSCTLKAKLFVDGGIDYLELNVDGKIHKLNLNDEDDQEQIKKMFCDLVELLETVSVKIELDVADDYDNTLLLEVSTSYISDLNEELESVRANLLEED